MSAATLIRRLTAAVLVPVVVLVGLATAQAFYRCAMDKVLRTSCCCPTAHRTRPTNTPQLKAVCCAVEKAAHVDVPQARLADDDASAPQPDLALFVVTLPAPVVAPHVTRVPDPRQQLAPPRTTGSLFSQGIALLV
jgi:hypothetical protein